MPSVLPSEESLGPKPAAVVSTQVKVHGSFLLPFFQKRRRPSFVNSRAKLRPTQRSKKLQPFFLRYLSP
jgi:hypothetical protein